MNKVVGPQLPLLLGSFAVISLIAGTAWIALALIAISVGAYIVLRAMDLFVASDRGRKLALTFAVGLLVTVFVALQWSGVIGVLNGDPSSLANQSVLTLGLPFYFLLIVGSYVDVLRNQNQMPSVLEYMLLINYFPKFLSGPLLSTEEFVRQIRVYRFVYDPIRIDAGVAWIVLGVLFKFGLSNGLERFIVRGEASSPIVILASAIAMELRVYFDLAGYSFIALGTSLCIGVEIPLNFRHPLLSRNVKEFWRNWHISLGKWYHAYLYLPLRSRYGGASLSYVWIPMLVFIVSAMWHGITLNFVFWGLFHGGVFVFYVVVLARFSWPRWAGLCGLWGFLVFGRLLFMDSDMSRLSKKIYSIFSTEAWAADVIRLPTILSQISAGACFHLIAPVAVIIVEAWSLKRFPNSPYRAFLNRKGATLCLIWALLLVHSEQSGFIYARQ